jgi:hypothetical protein
MNLVLVCSCALFILTENFQKLDMDDENDKNTNMYAGQHMDLDSFNGQ